MLSPYVTNAKPSVGAGMPASTQENLTGRNNITLRINFGNPTITFKPVRMGYRAVGRPDNAKFIKRHLMIPIKTKASILSADDPGVKWQAGS
jgi:hypothetical protein